MATDISGYVAFVTGAGSGIGTAIALKLAKAGCQVFLASFTLSKLEKVQQQILESVPDAKLKFAAFDLADKQLLEQAVETCVKEFGSLDIVVNNAGLGSLTSSPIELWDETIDINLKAAMRLSKFALPHLINSKAHGKVPSIINIASIAGRNHFGGFAPYCASKHGILGFTGSLFAALQTKGVRVTAIIPGWVDTPMVEHLEGYDPQKCVTVEQIADTIYFAVTFPANACVTELTVVPQIPWDA